MNISLEENFSAHENAHTQTRTQTNSHDKFRIEFFLAYKIFEVLKKKFFCNFAINFKIKHAN